MDDAALASANFWLPVIDSVKFWAEVGVVVCLAIGVIASFVGAPFAKRIEDARKLEIAALENGTEKLRSDNLRLQTILQPRRIIMGSRNGDEATRKPLFAEVAKYAGATALIQAVPDFEAQILASDIRTALVNSGWKVAVPAEGVTPVPPGLMTEGVRLLTLETSPFKADGSGLKPIRPEFSQTSEAARAVEKLLHLDLGPPQGPTFFGVHWEPVYEGLESMLGGFPLKREVVLVLVGMKPLSYMPAVPPAGALKQDAPAGSKSP